MKWIFLFCIGCYSAHGVSKISIVERCEKQSQVKKDIYQNVYSIVIDLAMSDSYELNLTMKTIYYGRLQILEWDRRTENELRVFVSPWDEWSRPVIKTLFSRLQKLSGIRVMCVPVEFDLTPR